MSTILARLCFSRFFRQGNKSFYILNLRKVSHVQILGPFVSSELTRRWETLIFMFLLRAKSAQPICGWVSGGCGMGRWTLESCLTLACRWYEWVRKTGFRGQEFRSHCWGDWGGTHRWSVLSRCCSYEVAVAGVGDWGRAVVVVVMALVVL